MKILIAVLSCHALRHQQEDIRSTWGKDVPDTVDLRFFLGEQEDKLPTRDEVFLECGDNIHALTHKSVKTFEWALKNGYDYVLKCDLDTLVMAKAMLETDFYLYPYVGGQNSFFASGGAGYWLSKTAMGHVVQAEVVHGREEDVHVAKVLMANQITLHPDNRYKFVPGDVLDGTTLTYHLSSVRGWNFPYTTDMMTQAYDDFNAGRYRAYIVHPEGRFKRRLGRS